MRLDVYLGEKCIPLEFPAELLPEAGDFFDKMDGDMDRGWQVGREWVDNPSNLERCQVAGDKLVAALEKDNQRLALLMAGYILRKLPQVKAIYPSLDGELQETEFSYQTG